MKNLSFLFAFIFLLSTQLIAQTPPNAFNYSAVARNAAGQPIATTTIGIQITILKTSSLGNAVYSENHFVNTDAFGLFNLIVGAGAVQSGSMSTIDWSNDNYYLKVGMDANGGTNFLTMGTTQLLSVPYALYAKSAGTVSGANETDPVFGASVAGGITGADTAKWNNKQNRIVAGTGISMAGDTLNAATQYQTLSISNDTVFLTNGGFVKLPAGSGGTGGNFTHYIGEAFGGGVIFHLWKDAQGVEHGLIIDKTDLSTSQVWSNINATLIGASAQSSWDGLSNSNAIVGQAGHTSSAASICLNSTNGGQSDWYLPSIDELSLLWHSRFNVNKSLSAIGGATVLPYAAYYWSSTEYDSANAWYFDFYHGSANYYYNKGYSTYVRAVRAF